MVRTRLDNVDLLRGIVMVVMALDHVRDFFLHQPFDPTDVTQTNPALFLTRWVTHFCAPVFIFLAGTGAFLYGTRCASRLQLAQFLFTRGLWLIFLELTLIRCYWTLNFDLNFMVGAVIWAIGCSMIVLSLLVFLPLPVIAGFGLMMIVSHNALDGIKAADCGWFGPAWAVLHTGEMVTYAPGKTFLPVYPLVPWIGVMAVGYAFGTVLQRGQEQRRRIVFVLGVGITAAFFVLRLLNVYGDPKPWSHQADVTFTLLSFLNSHKYPPSLLYLLMTLGPAVILLAALDREPGWVGRFFITFGRVPMFYYLLHLPLIIGLAALVAWIRYGPEAFTWTPETMPSHFGDLPSVYGGWIAVVLLLYPVCAWYARFKQRHRSVWLSYL